MGECAEADWELREKAWLPKLYNETLYQEWLRSPEEQGYRHNILPRIGYVDDALGHIHLRLYYPNRYPGTYPLCIDHVEVVEAIMNRLDYDLEYHDTGILGYDPADYDNLLRPYDPDDDEMRARLQCGINEWIAHAERETESNDLELVKRAVTKRRLRRLDWLKRKFNGDPDAAKAPDTDTGQREAESA